MSIDERPEVVKARSRIGDWEADTVIASQAIVLVTLVERRPRLSLIALAPTRLKRLTRMFLKRRVFLSFQDSDVARVMGLRRTAAGYV